MKHLTGLVFCTFFILSGCTTMTSEEVNNKRNELDTMAKKAIAELVKKDSSLRL